MCVDFEWVLLKWGFGRIPSKVFGLNLSLLCIDAARMHSKNDFMPGAFSRNLFDQLIAYPYTQTMQRQLPGNVFWLCIDTVCMHSKNKIIPRTFLLNLFDSKCLPKVSAMSFTQPFPISRHKHLTCR